jgi:hypothetical protein
LARFFKGLIHADSEEENRGDLGPLDLEHVRRALRAAFGE